MVNFHVGVKNVAKYSFFLKDTNLKFSSSNFMSDQERSH